MGAGFSHIDPTHVRIYNTLLKVQNLSKRQELLETLMAGNEYILSAKKAGIYSDLLNYLGALRQGRQPTRPLPGEGAAATGTNQIVATQKTNKNPMKVVAKQKNSEKALNFFTTCLRVLDLTEEVVLTEELLKKAYKKKAAIHHPDKGGSEELFESITRAYAYLSEIIKLVKGKRTRDGETAALPAIDTVREQRSAAAANFQQVEPVVLDAKNLNMETFNRIFEETRIPDPDDDGYGDWLKNEDSNDMITNGNKFNGKFNRNVFNQMFEEDARKRVGAPTNQIAVVSAQPLVMAPGFGLELGRERQENFTAPANSELQYTDLRHAYTKGATFSGEVAGVQIAERSIEDYKAARKNVSLTAEEQALIAKQEAAVAAMETQRQLRAAHEHVVADDYFERMKRRVILNH